MLWSLEEAATWACRCPSSLQRRAILIPLDEVMDRAEIIVVGAPHHAYRELDLSTRPLVDVWGLTEQGITV